jgi:glycogen(starch) synthase
VRLLLTADTVGGVWTYALELADALAEHDVEVTLAATGAPLTPDQRSALRSSRVARAFAADYALEWMEDPWRDLERAGHWLLEIAAEVGPDVVQLNAYAHAALPWDAPVVVVGHSDVLSWHEAVRERPAGPQWDRYRDVVREGLAAADLLVAPTRWMLDELVRLYNPPSPRCVIPNGSSRTVPARRKERLVLSAGRVWDEAKNVNALVRAAPSVPWPIAVAGSGPVGAGVRALGPLGREAMDEALAAAAIYAAPARYEPFGLAALEAARAGCALVLGDIASLREVWGDAALYVAPEEDDTLVRTLRTLADDAALLADFAARARGRARRYSAHGMAEAYMNAYRRVRDEQVVVAG